MVQNKISIAFVIAAATIAPVAALPIRGEHGGEFGLHFPEHPHRHHLIEVPLPQDPIE